MSAKAGWYDDPADRENSLRFWDGQRWTTHTSKKELPETSQPAEATPVSEAAAESWGSEEVAPQPPEDVALQPVSPEPSEEVSPQPPEDVALETLEEVSPQPLEEVVLELEQEMPGGALPAPEAPAFSLEDGGQQEEGWAENGPGVDKRELVVQIYKEGGSYWAETPNLPGVFAAGETLDELFRSLREGMSLAPGEEALQLAPQDRPELPDAPARDNEALSEGLPPEEEKVGEEAALEEASQKEADQKKQEKKQDKKRGKEKKSKKQSKKSRGLFSSLPGLLEKMRPDDNRSSSDEEEGVPEGEEAREFAGRVARCALGYKGILEHLRQEPSEEWFVSLQKKSVKVGQDVDLVLKDKSSPQLLASSAPLLRAIGVSCVLIVRSGTPEDLQSVLAAEETILPEEGLLALTQSSGIEAVLASS